MRALKTVLAIIFGTAAFFFLVMSSQGGAGQVPSIVLFVICALLALAFGRKTAADRERIANQKGKRATWHDAVAETSGIPRIPRGGRSGRRLLAGATVLHALSAPFIILKDLLKLQK